MRQEISYSEFHRLSQQRIDIITGKLTEGDTSKGNIEGLILYPIKLEQLNKLVEETQNSFMNFLILLHHTQM